MFENKRAILAVVLSLVVLIGWTYLADYMGWQPKPQPVAEESAVQNAAPESPLLPTAKEAAKPVASFVPTEGANITVETPLYTAVLNTQGGVLQKFTLKNYRSELAEDSPFIELVNENAAGMAPMGLLVNGQPSWRLASWGNVAENVSISGDEIGTVRFVGEMDGMHFERTLTFDAVSYLVRENVRVVNTNSIGRDLRLGFTVGTSVLSPEGGAYNATRLAWYDTGFDEEMSADTLSEKGVKVDGGVQWGGVLDNYFLVAVTGAGTGANLRGVLQEGVYRAVIEEPAGTLAGNTEVERSANYYIGPKDTKALSTMPDSLNEALYYGWFSFLAKPLIAALKFFYSFTGNYGIAIVILTIIIKAAFWPLSQKSYRSMEKMKRLQPMMQKIKEKCGDDRAKMNQEVMALYKTYKVNPAGGCLPMLVQIPVFFGLYQGLLNAVELRHAPFISNIPFTDFVWLADLSAKDPYYITPLVMGATMFLQQKLSPAPADPTQAKILMFMPLIFTFMFLNFPSGLVVYWLVNNVLSIGQQWLMLRNVK